MWNLVVSCRSCNEAKEDSDPSEEQLALVMSRRAWHECYVTLGKAIGRAVDAGEEEEALILKGMQQAIYRTMHNLIE